MSPDQLESEPVGIVVHVFTDFDLSPNIHVYILDLKEERSKTRSTLEPAIRINSGPFGELSVVIWKSTVYIMSESCLRNYKYSIRGDEDCLDIHLESCQELSAMVSNKLGVASVLIETKSGPKICLFSRSLTEDYTNFEMYDIGTDTWHILPEPLEDGRGSISYFFVDGPRFFVAIENLCLSMDFSRSAKDGGLTWQSYSYSAATGEFHQPILKDGHRWVITPHMTAAPTFTNYVGRQVNFNPHVDLGVIKVSIDSGILGLPIEEGERVRACIVYFGLPGHNWARTPFHLELYLLKFHGNKIIPDLDFSKSFLLTEHGSDSVFEHLRTLSMFPMSFLD